MADDADRNLLAAHAVKQLILAAAPERQPELERIWRDYSPEFAWIGDKLGFHLEAGPYGLILFTSRTMLQIWFLGFAAWKALQAYGGLLWFVNATTKEFTAEWLNSTEGQSSADKDFDFLVGKVKELARVENIEAFQWPDSVPRPQNGRPGDVQAAVVFDLTCLASAYVFLHEVRHVTLHKNGRPSLEAALEEFECDRFAREMLLGSLEIFSVNAGFPKGKVKSKRAMGVALASFVLLVVTPSELWGGSRAHPPIADRIRQLTDELDLHVEDSFWNYLACLILAQLRFEGQMPSGLRFHSIKDLCLQLLTLLGSSRREEV